jgi:hypothetical protein
MSFGSLNIFYLITIIFPFIDALREVTHQMIYRLSKSKVIASKLKSENTFILI